MITELGLSQRYMVQAAEGGVDLARNPDFQIALEPSHSGEHGLVYAWGSTARRISEAAHQEAYENTDGPFVAVDLCSAFPLWPQILRERHRQAEYERASQIVGKIGVALLAPRHKKISSELPFLAKIDENVKRTLKDNLPQRHSLLRKSLQASVFLAINDSSTHEDTPPEQTAQQLLDNFRNLKTLFHVASERIYSGDVETSRWPIVVAFGAEQTFEEMLHELVGEEHSGEIMEDLATFVSSYAQPQRPYHVFSLDCADPRELATQAKRSFPANFRDTDFFDRVAELGYKHVQANMLALPFKPGSISFFSCIEGYPFYFKGTPLEETVSVKGKDGNNVSLTIGHIPFAASIAESLTPGGRALFFPWHVQEGTEDDDLSLKAVEGYWEKQGLRMSKREYTGAELKKRMGDREYMLTDISPVFKGTTTLTALTLEKPRG